VTSLVDISVAIWVIGIPVPTLHPVHSTDICAVLAFEPSVIIYLGFGQIKAI